MTELALLVLAALAAVTLVRRRIAIVSVTGHSMEPALAAGDRVLVRRTKLRSVRTGQIVVVEAPTTLDGNWTDRPVRHELHRDWIIKRAAAIPGEPVPACLPGTLAEDVHVPEGKLVVLGDNRPASIDSRKMGYVPGDRLLGVVVGSLPRSASRP